MLVIESLQVLVHGFQLSMQDSKSLVPSFCVGKPPIPHQLELLLVFHLLSLTAGLVNGLDHSDNVSALQNKQNMVCAQRNDR